LNEPLTILSDNREVLYGERKDDRFLFQDVSTGMVLGGATNEENRDYQQKRLYPQNDDRWSRDKF
jgi:hypothetical protein